MHRDDFGQTILRLEESSAKMIEFRKTDPLSRYRPEQFRLRTNCPTVSTCLLSFSLFFHLFFFFFSHFFLSSLFPYINTVGHLRVHLHEQSNDDLSKVNDDFY